MTLDKKNKMAPIKNQGVRNFVFLLDIDIDRLLSSCLSKSL